MRIVVLASSPRKQGSTGILITEFIKGAKEKGHDIVRFDVASMDIKPCKCCGQQYRQKA